MGLEAQTGDQGLTLSQVALNTSNLSASLRLYTELFGFENAGCSAAWGDVLAMQNLGPDAHCIVWWMVGPQPFFQLEFFHHGSPRQRPQAADWRPCDHGWVRMGLYVDDFDRVTTGLSKLSIPVMEKSGSAPNRKLTFRDPDIGHIVEVIERVGDLSPAIAYVTSSVADIEDKRAYYRDVLRAEILPLEHLHSPEDEARWGLDGAERKGFVASLKNGLIEVVEYTSPQGNPRDPDHKTSDQGLMNIALASRSTQEIRDLIERIHGSGHETTVIVDAEPVCGTYVVESGYEMEFMSLPEELDGSFGFNRKDRFISAISG